MFFYRLKTFTITLIATAVALAFALAVRSANVCKLSQIEGERTFYLQSATSQALQKNTLDFADTFAVRGESVAFAIEAGEDKEGLARSIAEKYNAEILLVEEAGGTTSYYAYAQKLAGGITVRGLTVNLHIAVREGGCVVGTPIIFGGF